MKTFIDLFIRRPVFAAMLILGLVVFGVFSYGKLGVELFPNVEFPIVTVTVVYPGADPVSMESKVAKPVEDAVSTIGGIKRLRSVNTDSVTMVFIEFQLSVNGDKATQDIRDKLAGIESQLPQGIDPPKVQQLDIGAAPIMSVALSAPPNMTPRELTDLADDVVKERLQRVAGVGNVLIIGGRDREIHVQLDPAKLTARNLTPGDVAMALQGQNLELPAGHIVEGKQELVVTTKGAFDNVEEIANAPVIEGMGVVVRVRDVATVLDDMEEKRSHASLDGHPAVAVIVQKESGANTVEVANGLKAEMKAIEQQMKDKGVRMEITADNAPYIERSFEEVQFDLLLGAVLAIVIIMVFLRDWRATFISALALPTSVIATFWFLNLMGFTFNMMTMLALSLSIGLLIDDAIVVIENIHRHLEAGKSPLKAAAEATSEIALAVLATTLSIVAVFAPVATMQGIVGRFFLQFGLTVVFAVMVSLFVSFVLTPTLSARMLKVHHGKSNVVSRAIEAVLRGIERLYKRILGLALTHRVITLVTAGVLLFGSCTLVGQVKQEFLPPEDRSQLSVNVELPTGSSLETTTGVVETLAADVRATAPGVENTFVTIGGGTQGQVNVGKILVNMVRPHARPFKQQDLMAWLRERYASLKDKNIKVIVNEVNDNGGDDSGWGAQPVQYNLRSNDMDKLVAAAEALKAEMQKNKGLVDVGLSYRGGKPQIEITPDREAAAQLGVPVASIAQTLRALVAKDKVSEFKAGVDIYDITLTVPAEVEQTLATLSNITVKSVTGELIPLSSVVKLERGLGAAQIDRQGKMRQITIAANLAPGVALGDVTKDIEIAAAKVVPPDVVKETSGMGEFMQESFGYMFEALILAIILVYMILAAQFESFVHPFTIMLSLPLAVVGAFGGLFLAGQTMSIFSMIGLIMLMGLVTKNAILLVDYANHQKEQGLSTREALLKAGPVRLRPILMTTAAMILGMLPVALALGEGGEQRAPMAVVVIGGLITSTMLTLVVVPVVYSLFEGLRAKIWRRRTPPSAHVVEMHAE
jgi:hydrophobic/amphiphilic exporter-1 (mainly G- bacteria), HAE1 family